MIPCDEMDRRFIARDPLTEVQIRIGVMGAAGGDLDVSIVERCRGLGRAVAERAAVSLWERVQEFRIRQCSEPKRLVGMSLASRRRSR